MSTKTITSVIEPLSALVAVSVLAASCSANPRRDSNADTGTDLDADVDTDDTDTASETESATDIDQGASPWVEMPEEIQRGSAYQVVVRDADDALITGHFLCWAIKGVLLYDGALDLMWGPPDWADWDGLGACASAGDGYYVYAGVYWFWAGGWPYPGFLSVVGAGWTDLGLPGSCATWKRAPAESGHFHIRRHITCLDSGGFAALLTCEEPGDVPDPVEPGHHVVVYDGAEWSVLLSFPLDAPWPLLISGRSTDDLLVFLDRPTGAPGYRFDGGTLALMTAPPGDWTHLRFLGLADNPGGGFVVVGVSQEGGTAEDVCPKGFAWRSEDGLEWTALEVPLAPDPEYPCEEFRDVWISGGGEVFIAGTRLWATGYGWHWWPLLLHRESEMWQEVELPPSPLVLWYGRLISVRGFDRTVFVSGSFYWEFYNYGAPQPVLLRYEPE